MLTQADILQQIADNRRVRWVSALHLAFLLFEIAAVRISTFLETGSAWTSQIDLLGFTAPVTVSLVAAASLVLTYTRSQRAARALQVLSLLLGGSAAIALNPTSTPASGTFFGLALFLANRYGFLDRYARIKTSALLVSFLASVFIAGRLYLSQIFFALMGAIAFVLTYTAMWFFAAELEVRGLVSRYSSARLALIRSKRNEDFGRGALAFVHAMSGRMIALERVVEVIRDGTDRDDGLNRLVAIREEISYMLASLKLSMVHQTESEPRDVKVGDVLKGLVVLAEVTRDGDGKARPLSLEVLEDVGLRAPPAELYMMFETVLRNALEAGAPRIAITVGPGRRVVMANDGPPIPFCAGCRRNECMECREFREGRTTKKGGSGIGMVVVREIMSRYGSLSISSGPDQTEVAFRFD